MVVSSPKKLSSDSKTILEELKENYKKAKISIKNTIKDWKGEKLKDILDADSVDEIKKILK